MPDFCCFYPKLGGILVYRLKSASYEVISARSAPVCEADSYVASEAPHYQSSRRVERAAREDYGASKCTWWAVQTQQEPA